jgi:hypothetical protein
MYKRAQDGIEMVNCSLALKDATLQLFVDLYARKRSTFSPLVEEGQLPKYTPIERTGQIPQWPAPL